MHTSNAVTVACSMWEEEQQKVARAVRDQERAQERYAAAQVQRFELVRPASGVCDCLSHLQECMVLSLLTVMACHCGVSWT